MSSLRKPYEGSVKGLIEVELGKNSRAIMHFLFLNILDRPQKNDLKLFFILVSRAEKRLCDLDGSLKKGASKVLLKLSYVCKNSHAIMTF